MSTPTVFIPYALSRAPIVPETRVVTPLTAERDYSAYGPSAWQRTSERRTEALIQKMEADLAYWHEHGCCRPRVVA